MTAFAIVFTLFIAALIALAIFTVAWALKRDRLRRTELLKEQGPDASATT
ncbi:MAG: hypothetical protein NT160_06420 [Actinobacteria bacterium]|jgi:Flp pilus assembly protein TadB|nr:hypothetical protein [Actinomycetota bacterium]